MTKVEEHRSDSLRDEIESFRRELTGYCYRMLGSAFDAEDAVQESLVRAWRSADRFEGRSSVRTWLYRITTNVCLDHLAASKRRARPMELSDRPWSIAEPMVPPNGDHEWLEPIPDGLVLASPADPASIAADRETIRLAFVAALQHLPPKQRSVLILRDVLRWQASEVAELLDTTVAATNSAHQRARATLAEIDHEAEVAQLPSDAAEQELLARYVDCFERYDIDAFVTLLRDDATQNMPPYEMWMRGRDDIRDFMLGPGHECRGSRLVPLRANGRPAFAQYRPSGPDGAFEPWSIHVVELDHDGIAAITYFLDTTLFPMFGLGPTPGEPPAS